MITRRKFVGHAATTIVAGSLPLSLAHAKRPGGGAAKARSDRALRRFRRGNRLGREEFESLLNEVFYVYGGPAGVVDLHLVSVMDGPISQNVEQFFLDFRGPSSPSLVSETYEAEHSGGKRFDLYLEHVGSDGEASYYSASFSLIV